MRPSPCVTCWCGGVLLSHILSNAVPSPCQVFASGFGMGPGVSPGPWPPQIFDYHPTGSCVHVFPCGGIVAAWGPDGGRVCVLKDRSVMRGVSPRHPSKVIVSFVLPPLRVVCSVAVRLLVPVSSTPCGASTSGLSTMCSAWSLQTPEGVTES